MDMFNLSTGLALLAIALLAAGIVAWNRSRRGAELGLDADAPDESPPSTPHPQRAGTATAHQAAAKAVIEQAQARAAAQGAAVEAAPLAANAGPVAALARVSEPVPAPIPQFDGPAWAPTEPMPGMGVEPQFADTMPAEMDFGDMSFADTLVTEIVAEERPSPVPGLRRRPS